MATPSRNHILTPVETEAIIARKLHARQIASRRVTVARRFEEWACGCESCINSPRRPAELLVNIPPTPRTGTRYTGIAFGL